MRFYRVEQPSSRGLEQRLEGGPRLLTHEEARRIAANIAKLPGASIDSHFRYDLNFAGLRSLTSWAINCGLACCQEAALLAEVVDGANLV